MTEGLTLEELDVLELQLNSASPKFKWGVSRAIRAARAHLSRPVVGDEQMREALELARKDGALQVSSVGPDDRCWFDPETGERYNDYQIAEIYRTALLALSEQLAAEQEKVKALQPYKDAYEAGQTYGPQDLNSKVFHPLGRPVRVCKVVSPESTAEMVEGD